jgi:3-isopropylmalate/(R)-2-methylmalate dehydratase small subunit
MEQFSRLTGRMVALPSRDVDTDQITPARFLKITDKLGLAKVLFYDWRYDAAGKPRPEFPLNKPGVEGAPILVAGHNFGCGSSREHAPWALGSFGFRAIVSTSFADIFRNNCLKNGLLPVAIDAASHAELMETAQKDASAQITIDLATQTLTLPSGKSVSFPIDPFSKQCLLDGVDQLGYILKHQDAIAAYERKSAA